MERILQGIKYCLPQPLLNRLLPQYHRALAYYGSVYYKHPSRELTVIAVTGTKGKSTVVELIARILKTHGHTVASASTIQFMIDEEVTPNRYKMTTPGRSFLQHFLRRAADANCTHAVIELTSEGAVRSRHRYLDFDALVFTNLTPEHIESHGSFTQYKEAKLLLAQAVANSPKRPRYLVANTDDEHGADFLNFPVEHTLGYSLKNLTLHSLQKDSVSLVLENTTIRVPLVGKFNVYNILAALTLTRALGVPLNTIERSLRDLPTIAGRMEHLKPPAHAHKNITVVVDYAHTPDSLTQLYNAFPKAHKVCVLGNAGGGRDTWKRSEMAQIAEAQCHQIILTNEDPYDEPPRQIVEQMRNAIEDQTKVEIIMDRGEAIRRAIEQASEGSYVLISGKGTDPYIMGPHGTKTPWSDAEVAQEALNQLAEDQTA